MLQQFASSQKSRVGWWGAGLLALLAGALLFLLWPREAEPANTASATSQDATSAQRKPTDKKARPALRPFLWNINAPTSLPAGKELRDLLRERYERLEKPPRSFRDVWSPGLAKAFERLGGEALVPMRDYFLQMRTELETCMGDHHIPRGFVFIAYIFEVDEATQIGTGSGVDFRDNPWGDEVLEKIKLCILEYHVGKQVDFTPRMARFGPSIGTTYLATQLVFPIEESYDYQILLTDGQIVENWGQLRNPPPPDDIDEEGRHITYSEKSKEQQ